MNISKGRLLKIIQQVLLWLTTAIRYLDAYPPSVVADRCQCSPAPPAHFLNVRFCLFDMWRIGIWYIALISDSSLGLGVFSQHGFKNFRHCVHLLRRMKCFQEKLFTL